MLFERRGHVGKPMSRDRSAALHQLASLNIILGRVNAVERNDAACLGVHHRETPAGYVAAHDRFVITGGKPNGLQPQIILIRPEPRHRVIGPWIAGNHSGDDARLIVGVLDRLETDDRPARLLQDEHTELRWLSVEEMRGLPDVFPEDIELFARWQAR